MRCDLITRDRSTEMDTGLSMQIEQGRDESNPQDDGKGK